MYWYDVVVRIVLSAVCGIAVGCQREYYGHPAGIKTNAMVCLGATVISLIQLQLAEDFPTCDPTRITAQVVSGIGFIGAGCILRGEEKGHHISGLTTASTLWVVACLGIAIGFGYYLISVLGLILVLSILMLFGMIRSKHHGEKTTKLKQKTFDDE